MSNHHSHELSEHPEVQWALDLLKPDPTYQPSVMSKYATEAVFMIGGFALPSLTNIFTNKPFYTKIQSHITYVAAGYILSQCVKKLVENYQAERDTRLRDYIIRHPELFPEPERVKYSQVLEDWTPVR